MSEKKGAKQVRSEDKKGTARNKERKRCENLGREKKPPKDKNLQGTRTDTNKEARKYNQKTKTVTCTFTTKGHPFRRLGLVGCYCLADVQSIFSPSLVVVLPRMVSAE